MRHVAYKTWAQGRLALQRGDVETTNTTARPQQGTAETGITSAPENCTKNTHFAPAKAMTVSVEARPSPAKAMTVSDNRPSWPTGPGCGAHSGGGAGCGARGRRRGRPGFDPTHQATRQRTRSHWCGGRRRVRRARAGFEIDHSEPQARVWRSRGRPGPTAPGTPAEPQATPSMTRAAAHGHTKQPGPTNHQAAPGTPAAP